MLIQSSLSSVKLITISSNKSFGEMRSSELSMGFSVKMVSSTSFSSIVTLEEGLS